MNEAYLHPDAQVEFDRAIDWYREIDPDLAQRFQAAVGGVLTKIATTPQLFGWRDENFREALVRKFPYCVIFRQTSGNRIFIVAIAHTSRDPEYWRSRISQEQ